MAIAAFTTLITVWGYIICTSIVSYRNYGKRKQLEAKRAKIDYHLDFAERLLQIGMETNDKDFIEYSNQELDKAEKLIETIK